MATRSIEIRCEHCREWFRSPIQLGDEQVFDTAVLAGNLVECPQCGEVTGCDKENMRASFDDGGFKGNKTA